MDLPDARPDPHAPYLEADGALVAPRFGDLYFQGGGAGLAETRHVFLDGNRLDERFAAAPGRARIGETGFGTGLNFLAAWQRFRVRAADRARLTWISIERWPLDPGLQRRALAAFGELAPLTEQLVGAAWRGDDIVRRASFDDGRVTLCLLVGDVLDALREHRFVVDAWCLDGFAPARNPAMWSPEVLAEVARHTRPGGTFATFTAAGAVRRALGDAGFDCERRPGFGAKRHMLRGVLARPQAPHGNADRDPDRVHVAGAGLAGAGAARAFAERGCEVHVHDPRGIAGGASGQTALVLQPRLGATPDARIVAQAFAWTRTLLLALDPNREVWRDCGVLHPASDAVAAAKLRARLVAGPAGDAVWLDSATARSIAGFDPGPHGALWIPTAGVLRPRAWCARLLDHPRITVHRELGPEQPPDGAVLVIAAGPDSAAFAGGDALALRPTRGQATVFATPVEDGAPTAALSASGYCTPDLGGVFVVGGTYARDDRDLAPRAADDAENRGRFDRWEPLRARLSTAAIVRAEVGVRATTAQHLPRIGPMPGRTDGRVLVSAGHGSRGAATAAFAGELLAILASGEPRSMFSDVLTRCSPS